MDSASHLYAEVMEAKGMCEINSTSHITRGTTAFDVQQMQVFMCMHHWQNQQETVHLTLGYNMKLIDSQIYKDG